PAPPVLAPPLPRPPAPALLPALAPLPLAPVPAPLEPRLASGSVACRRQRPLTLHALGSFELVAHVAASSRPPQSACDVHSSVQTPQMHERLAAQSASASHVRSQLVFELPLPLLAESLPHPEAIASARAAEVNAKRARDRDF